MANVNISELNQENATAELDTILEVEVDPGGSPSSGYHTVDEILAANDARTKTLTNTTIDADNNTISNLAIGSEVSATVGADLNMNGNDITDVHEIRLDGTPDADHTANGFTTVTFNAGTTVSQHELVYMASDGEWALADADATATTDKFLAIALEAGTDGNPMDVALPGSFVRDDTWDWTVGGAVYASTTAGALTQTAPSATADVVRVVGYAVSADVIWFQPETGVVHA